MAKVTILIEVKLNTDKDDLAVENAIKKGIYWGLDVKNVSEPKLVDNISIKKLRRKLN